MKASAIRRFRQKLKRDEPTYGIWVSLESATVTEIAVTLGLDWVVIDTEHGHLDWHNVLEHLRATVRSDTVALVRLQTLDIGLIKRALDIGADGVIIPWMENVSQLEQAVAFAHYPPRGLRGIGGERSTVWGRALQTAVQDAEELVLVVPIIESVRGGRNIEALCQVPGVDVMYIGPADYSSTAGYPGQWEGPGVAEQIQTVKDAIRRAGKQCGVVATSHEDLLARRDQGFRMIGLGLDAGLLIRSITGAMDQVGKKWTLHPDLSPLAPSAPTPSTPLARPPESMRPDRPEVMCKPGDAPSIEIAPLVSFSPLVGSQIRAKKITTGIVTFAVGGQLPYHLHTFGESITLLSGSALVEVEGRQYVLEVLDNVTIPRGCAHHVVNTGNEPAVFHVAMATEQPTRILVDQYFPRQPMPYDAKGQEGGETVVRFRLARRYEAGPNTSFIDHMNRGMLPAIEMSGGYGLFYQGGRLPAHVHDFDESICIIQGLATCVVEGKRYPLRDRQTALQPRGRVHYFINERPEPMAMLWVYGGPMPERIVVDERCATVEGNPWK